MKLKSILCVLIAGACCAGRLAKAATAPFEFNDGDRIALVGNEFFERDIDAGYIETQLTTRFPEKHLTFRNLGYAGDNVQGDARSLCAGWDNFGPADQGFNRLKELVEHLKPTVIFVAYGMNESFDGEKGLQNFQHGLERMLDMLSLASKARLVLISPTRQEALPRLPDPTEHNRNLGLYVATIASVATQRNLRLVDLFTTPAEPAAGSATAPLTFDGIRLTPYGYWRAAIAIEQGLGYPPRAWNVEMDAAGKPGAVVGTALSEIKKGDGISFTATDALLPVAASPLIATAPAGSLVDRKLVASGDQRVLKISGLSAGSYTLTGADSAATESPVTIVTATAEQWAKGVELTRGPAEERVAALRHLIHAKNLDWFNYWRPENDTYILGYRKGEQGRNAVELPKFEELAQAKDPDIAKLNHGFAIVYRLAASK